MVQFHLKVSKCDQFGSGADVVISSTCNETCPVTAIVNFVSARGNRPGPFFIDATGNAVTKSWFVREILTSCGLPQHSYAGHSFRIGAVTTAVLLGMEDSSIQVLGRWHSPAFLQYIQTPKGRLAALSASLASQVQVPPCPRAS